MKKLAFSLSPFLVLIFPVLLFVGLSLGIQEEIAEPTVHIPHFEFDSKSQYLTNIFPQSFIKLLLK